MTAVSVTLDFKAYRTQIDGADGASMCQFSAERRTMGAYTYASLEGFPNDSPKTSFGKFCDTAFSSTGTKAMALHHLWATPSSQQTPKNAVGETYDPQRWKKLKFTMYEPDSNGHTVAFFRAALSRARQEGKRILLWTDLHFTYPRWMWAGDKPADGIDERLWNQAALHCVYFVKYLVSKHGIPIYAACFMNEPDIPRRHTFTENQAMRFIKIAREKFDEAGLQGVRLIPATWWIMNERIPRLIAELRKNMKYQRYVDIIAGHNFYAEPPCKHRLDNKTAVWIASGKYRDYWCDEDGYLMGPDDRIDETIRIATWRFARGISLQGVWQLQGRLGMDGGVKKTYDPYRSGTHHQIDGPATVWQYVRPGMFLVDGSLGGGPADEYSVDGFGGRGHNEVVVITSTVSKTFSIRLKNISVPSVHVYQCRAGQTKQDLGEWVVENNRLRITVPAHSVTSLVVTRASTRPRLYFVVKDKHALNRGLTTDTYFIETLTALDIDVRVVYQNLPASQQTEYRSRRHPVDSMGAALYILGRDLKKETGYAYRSVMAPVIAFSKPCHQALGCTTALQKIDAGALLAARDELDPPPEMLESGLPRACGKRIALNDICPKQRFRDIVRWALS
jgi:hypothetical protein